MQTEINDAGVLTKEITVTIPKEDLKKQYEQKLVKIAKEINLPGFRQGKVPTRVVEMKHKAALLDELRNDLISTAINTASKAVESIGDWDLKEEDEKFDIQKDFTCVLATSVFPTVTLTDFKELKYKKEQAVVTAEDVDMFIKKLLKQNGEPVRVEDNSPIEDGDMVKFTYEISVEGASIKTADSAATGGFLFVDSVDVPKEAQQLLIGKKNSDVVTFAAKLRDNFSITEHANKECEVKVTITEYSRQKAEELTDDLAKKLGADSVDMLKELISKSLLERKVGESNSKIQQDLLDAFIEKTSVDIPEKLLKDHIHAEQHKGHHHDHEEEHVHDENCDHDHDHDHGHDHDHDHDHHHAPVDEEALKTRLKKQLVLEMIYRQHNIKVSEKELMDYISSMARSYGMPIKDFVKNITQDLAVQIESELKYKKALDLIHLSAVAE